MIFNTFVNKQRIREIILYKKILESFHSQNSSQNLGFLVKSTNGPVSILFFITKKEFILENNNIVEEIFPFFKSFPQF
jgi:hypothetical protein